MALHLLWLPSTFSTTDQKQQTLSLHKPSKTSFSSSLSLSSSNSHSSIILHSTRRTNLLIFQVFCTTTEVAKTIETPTEELEQEPKTRLIAQNIPWSATSDDLKNLFQKHGNVVNVELSLYSKTKNRGLAFITMGSEEEAVEALAKLDSSELEGRTINVAYAKARKKEAYVMPLSSRPKFDVFVANLSWKIKDKDLLEFFGPMRSDVVAAEVTYRMNPTRKPTGYGFVSFHTKEKAEEAIAAFQGKELMGKPVRLAFSNRSLKEESKDGSTLGETSTDVTGDEVISENADA